MYGVKQECLSNIKGSMLKKNQKWRQELEKEFLRISEIP